jgi:hypothetical protein
MSGSLDRPSKKNRSVDAIGIHLITPNQGYLILLFSDLTTMLGYPHDFLRGI